MVWSDDFDGPNGSLPNADNWVLEQYADATDTEKQCYTNHPDNVHLDGGGYLVDRRARAARPLRRRLVPLHHLGPTHHQGLHSWKHGRFEIRAKMPTGVGTWPAFWAIGEEKGKEWPEVGEMDVLEYVGRDRAHVIGTVHGATEDGDQWFLQGRTTSDSPLSADMHTYAMEWDSDRVRWYLDDVEYAQVTRGEVEDVGVWAFDRPFHLILNLAMGGVLGGEVPDSLTYPQYFVVDWVRVYQ